MLGTFLKAPLFSLTRCNSKATESKISVIKQRFSSYKLRDVILAATADGFFSRTKVVQFDKLEDDEL